MEELRVGVIGTGGIGRERIERLQYKIAEARVTAVCARTEKSSSAAAEKYGARALPDLETLIRDEQVDAVVVSCNDPEHAPAVLLCIEAGKPVFCEKPLALTAEDCRRIMKAEMAGGKKLVQVGFQRRYDKAYRQLKAMLEGKPYGETLMIHNTHRNPDTPVAFETNFSFSVYRKAIHDIDSSYWLLGDEFVSAQIVTPRPTKHTRPGFMDPQIMLLRSQKGTVVTIEVALNCRYGYDIRCEVCCEDACIRLPEPSLPELRMNEARRITLEDWNFRFKEAYDHEMEDWVRSTLAGEVNGPTSWDGYIASVTADALAASLKSGATEAIKPGEKPVFYA